MVNLSSDINGTGIPAFLAKLWALVDDHNTNNLISWTENGSSFVVSHPVDFAREILPKYFKHNNMTSFIRQLNMYGFRKIANVDNGNLSRENEALEFFHPYFIKGNIQLLALIKRKITYKNEENKFSLNIASDLSEIKSNQIALESKIEDIKKENGLLWDELLYMRQKYNKQQIIVKKLIQFLMAMMAPSFKMKRAPFINHSFFDQDNIKAINPPKIFPMKEIKFSEKERLLPDQSLESTTLLHNDINTRNLMGIPNIYDASSAYKRSTSQDSQGLSAQVNSQLPQMEIEIGDNDGAVTILNESNKDLPYIMPPNFRTSSTHDGVMEDDMASVLSDKSDISNQTYKYGVLLRDQFIPQALRDHIIVGKDPTSANCTASTAAIKNHNETNSITNLEGFATASTPIHNPSKGDPRTVVENIFATIMNGDPSSGSALLDESHQLQQQQPCTSLDRQFSTSSNSKGTLGDLSFDDIYEQMYDMIDENALFPALDRQNSYEQVNKNSSDTGALLSPVNNTNVVSRDYFNNHYNNEASMMNLKDMLSQSNFSIDSKLLMDLLGSIDTTSLMNTNPDLLTIRPDSKETPENNESFKDIRSPLVDPLTPAAPLQNYNMMGEEEVISHLSPKVDIDPNVEQYLNINNSILPILDTLDME